MKIAIIGLGLMGGSLGLALKKHFQDIKVFGYDHNSKHEQEALKLGLIDKTVSFEELKKSDMIFLTIPVESIIDILQKLKDINPNTTIIDFGSTKEKIVKSVPKEIKKNFIAAHPMSGTEKFGPSAAIENLYEDKIIVLCNIDDKNSFHAKKAIELFSKIGMKIVYMDAKEHDMHAAYISHLPHAISYALANAVMKQENPENILVLAAGGFKDMGRLAKSSPNMWSDIFKQNKHNLLDSIEAFEKELAECKKLIQNDQYDKLKKWMKSAVALHEI